MKQHILFFLLLVVISYAGNAQLKEISGTVYTFNKYPLKKISVKAKKSKQETETDENGKFKIHVKKNDLITIDADSFEKYVYRINLKDQTVKINLIYKDNEKNKELAIKNGYLNREDLEYGIENLMSENTVFNNFTDIFDAVHYALPAVSFIVENGVRKIMIRGAKSVQGSNAALTVVDGVPVDDISFLNPSEILSITQLSSSQVAIYGARGGNGVIIINSK